MRIKPDPMTVRAKVKDPKVVLGSIVIKNLSMQASVSAVMKGDQMSGSNGNKPARALDIEHAKQIAKKLGVEGVIILVFDKLPNGEFKGVSYGADPIRCQTMGLILDKIDRAIQVGAGGIKQ